MKDKKNNGILLILVMTIVLLLVLCILFAAGIIGFKHCDSNEISNNIINNQIIENENTNNVINNDFSFNDYSGVYTFETEELLSGEMISVLYELKLYENGLFEYKMATMAPWGYIGNYLIDNNKIILNYLFRFNSGWGFSTVDNIETKEIIISNDYLIDVHQSIKGLSFDTVNLTKDNSKKITNEEILNKIYTTPIINDLNN